MSADRFAPPPHRRLPFGLALTALLASLVAASSLAQSTGSPGTPAIPPSAPGALRPVERTFLERAAELSRQQMRLAQLAVSQAASSDVRTYAQQVASDNRQIGDSVEGLRRRKAAVVKPVEPAVSQAFQRLAEKAGADFDREFVRVAGDLHASALTLFEEVMADARDPDVRDLIGTYLPVLRDHQNRATELQKTFD